MYLYFFFRFIGVLLLVMATSQFANADTFLGDQNIPCFGQAALNPVTNRIYKAGNNRVCVLDAESRQLSFISVPARVSRVAINSATNQIYAIGDRNVFAIDGETGATRLVYFTTPESGFVNRYGVNSNTNSFYLTESQSNQEIFVAVDESNGTLRQTVLAGVSARSLAIDVLRNRVYLADRNNDRLLVMDGGTGAMVASIDLPTFVPFTNLDLVVVDPSGNRLYCSWAQFDNRIAIIDATTFDVTYTAPVYSSASIAGINSQTGKVYFTAGQGVDTHLFSLDRFNNIAMVESQVSERGILEINELTNKIYLPIGAENSIRIIDADTNTRQVLSVGTKPVRVLINAVTNKGYISYFRDDVTLSLIDGDDNRTTSVFTGQSAQTVAIEPGSNQAYLLNPGSNSVTAINGFSNSVQTLGVGANPVAIATNSISRRVYVVNRDSGTLSVINSMTNAVETLAVAPDLVAIAVNQTTNKVYVASAAGAVFVVDGDTQAVQALPTLTNDVRSIVVNENTNRVYVSSYGNGNVIVIDGQTNSVETLDLFNSPEKMAVDPVSNNIYILDRPAGNVWILNGVTHSLGAVDVGPLGAFSDIDINPQTGFVYVATGTEVAIISRINNSVSTLSVGLGPRSVRVNTATNKIYTTNFADGTMTMIDGLTNATSSFAVGSQPLSFAISPLTDRIYIANRGSQNATIVDPSGVAGNALTTTVQQLVGNRTSLSNPTFSLTATTSNFGLQPRNIYYQTDSRTGRWRRATNIFGTSISLLASATIAPVNRGTHTIYFYAVDGAESQTASIHQETLQKASAFSGGDATGIGLTGGYQFAVNFVPTSATSYISGRITDVNGNGIRRAMVFVTDQSGAVREAQTGTFGHFRVEGLTVGQTYAVSVSHGRFQFEAATRVVELGDRVTDLVFIAAETAEPAEKPVNSTRKIPD